MNAPALCLFALLALPLALELQEDARSEESSIATLLAQDDLACAFDFRAGRSGGRIEDGEIRLEDAQLAFGAFARDRMTVGFVHDEHAALLDLGILYVEPDVRARDGAAEFAVSAFHTLAFDGTRFSYRGPGEDVRFLDQADRILGPLPSGPRELAPVVGHVYLLRVRRDDARATDELFKLEVIDFQPGRSLTIRWARLQSP
jgi:hypothetical protein